MNKIINTRFTSKQKKRFMVEIEEEAKSNGYDFFTFEKRVHFSKVKNIMVGNFKSANIIYMVPYDTPAKVFWPNFKYYPLNGRYFMMKNFLPVYGPILLSYVFLLFLVYVVPNYLNTTLKSILFLFSCLYLILLFKLIFKGFSNKNNAQRNDAGISLLIEKMRERNKDTAFIFMDASSNKGYGATLVKEYLNSIQKNPFKIVLNCIGKGNTICIGHVKGSRKEAIELSKKVRGVIIKSMDEEDTSFTPLEGLDDIVCISSGILEDKYLCVYDTASNKDTSIDETIYEKVKKLL